MMSLRSSFASLVAVVSGCALAFRGVPRGLELGTVAVDLFGAEGTLVLHSLDLGSSQQIAIKAGETRLAEVPAGFYSIELVSGAAGERGSAPSSVGRGLIVVAAGQVTTLRLAIEGDTVHERLAA
jgi:hypothetical protein